MGDGMLIEFQSVTEALRCAVDFQERMARGNRDMPASRALLYRIGVNLGDVIVDESDIFGEGVNVAARLESIAEPGGISISAAVRDQVGDRLDVTYEDLGEQQVKNINRPIRVYRVLTGGQDVAPGGDGANRHAAPKESAKKPAIAILPFVNMSGDPEQEFFADGLSEDIGGGAFIAD
jgi:adenylate cyclase